MTASEIIMLISTIFTAIAGIAAAITCILHYINSKPNIKVNKSDSPNHYFFFERDKHFYAVFALNVTNSTSVNGVVDDVALIYNKTTHYAEVDLIDLSSVTRNICLEFANQIVDLSNVRLKCPLKMSGNSIQYGFFIVPDLPLPNNTKEFTADIIYKIIGKHGTSKFKNIKFELM